VGGETTYGQHNQFEGSACREAALSVGGNAELLQKSLFAGAMSSSRDDANDSGPKETAIRAEPKMVEGKPLSNYPEGLKTPRDAPPARC
jgi:hypothetical protein